MHLIKAKQILSTNSMGMNVYRGCLHGCIYCDARSKCYHIDHIFEDIAVKINAPELLENTLRRKRKKCMIGTGSMCDPYIPLENDLRITRKCLELIDKYNFGVAMLTKSNLVMRDIDLYQKINNKTKAVLQMTLTTYDEALCALIEPNVCSTNKRFEVLCEFRDRGIPTVVWLCPILPFINDTMENLEGIMDYCVRAGVKGIINFGFGVTLRDGDREYFYTQLDKNFPGLKEKYIKRYGNSYEVGSDNQNKLYKRFVEICKANLIEFDCNTVFKYLHTYESKSNLSSPIQGELF